MGKNTVFILIGFAIAFAIGYFLLKGMKIGASANSTDQPETTVDRPTVADLKAKGYDDSEIALIVASESYKNGTGSW